MYSYSIAMSLMQTCFLMKTHTWLCIYSKGGAIISIQFKFWIVLGLYLTYLGFITLLIIMVMLKLL